MDTVVRGKLVKLCRENSYNNRGLGIMNSFCKNNFPSQICFYDSHSISHTKQVRYRETTSLFCPSIHCYALSLEQNTQNTCGHTSFFQLINNLTGSVFPMTGAL